MTEAGDSPATDPSPALDPDAGADVQMVALLPCADIDEIAAFWTALGLTVTYRQLRPNPFVAFERGGIALQYYGMPDWDPELSHSTCVLVTRDTEPLHELFAAGLRSLYGRLPAKGFPRMTRPRRRANNAGLSGFSLIDPAGNWVRVTARPDPEHTPRAVDERTEWVTEGGGPVARALENAIVLGDSHGDEAQAARALTGALRRNPDAPIAEAAPAWAYLVELRVRLGDPEGAREAASTLRGLDTSGLAASDQDAVRAALGSIEQDRAAGDDRS